MKLRVYTGTTVFYVNFLVVSYNAHSVLVSSMVHNHGVNQSHVLRSFMGMSFAGESSFCWQNRTGTFYIHTYDRN